jgi:hypothetical protein
MPQNKYIIREFYDFKPNVELIKEAEENNKPIVLSGILQKANTLNRNGRVYPYDILKREAERYMEEVDNGRALGECDHPESAVVSLRNASHKVIDMWWQGEALYGKVQLLDDDCDAAYMFKENKQWGITPITEEEYKKMKCENGICRIVTEEEENSGKTLIESKIEDNEFSRKLINKINNSFWNNIKI